MYSTGTGHKLIRVVTNKVTIYYMTFPLYRETSHEIGEALINYLFCQHGPSSYLFFDEYQTSLSSTL